MNKTFLLLLVSLLLFSACSKKPVSFSSKKKKFAIEEVEFQNFNSRSKVSYKDPNTNLSFNANIRIKRDSLIWVSLSPLLGIEAARAIITCDSMVLLNRLEKEYTVYDFKSLSKKFNFEIDFKLIQNVLLGNMPHRDEFNDRIYREKDYYVVKQSSGPVSIDNYVSARTMKVEKVEMVDLPSKNSLNLLYSDFRLTNKRYIPFSSLIGLLYESNHVEKETKISIVHNRVDFTEKEVNYHFSIPEKYVRK